MEEINTKKGFHILKMTIFFLLLFCLFLILYSSPLSYIEDTYGLSGGPKELNADRNFVGILDFVYVKSICFLYLFLGEKPGIITGYHIFVRMLCCLFLFIAFYKTKKFYLAAIVTALYGACPFLLSHVYHYDGIIIAEIMAAFLLMVIASIIKVIVKRRKMSVAKNNTKIQQLVTAGEGMIDMKDSMEEKKDTLEANSGKDAPNFLEISDEEIRRNAMIAAGLLPAEEKSSITDRADEKEQKPFSHTKFIENPLPVPKKHVKKEMDYEYQVPEDKMYYDIEEPDKNYFDIV